MCWRLTASRVPTQTVLVTFNRSGPTVDAILQAKRHGHESTDKYAARGAAHRRDGWQPACWKRGRHHAVRSEEHTSELQSLMRTSYAVFCLKKKQKQRNTDDKHNKQQQD